MVRCFIAVPVPEGIKRRVLELQHDMKKVEMSCKFVEEDNMHITLSFLGEKNEEDIEKIHVQLGYLSKKFSQIPAKVCGLKIIPSESYIRVIALGVFDENKELERLSSEIKNSVGGDVKPPHLTVCRVKKIKNKVEVLEKLKIWKDFDAGSFTITEIKLMKSELSREGPSYEVMQSYQFD